MKIIIPQNLFSAIWALTLDDKDKAELVIKKSSLVTQSLMNNEAELALIPSMDLLSHKDLFVSTKFSIAFDGNVSNSLFLFSENKTEIETVTVRGDVSSNELILTKLLFSERFDMDVEVELDTNEDASLDPDKNYLIVGNENYFDPDKLFNKVSFADLLAELLNFPYVNFVVASKSEEAIKQFNENYVEVDSLIEDNADDYLTRLSLDPVVKGFLAENINTIYYDMTTNEEMGLTELIRLPFYHGMIKDIIEVKFI